MPWKLLADYNTFILGWLGGLRRFSRTSRWHHDLRLLSRSKVRFTSGRLVSSRRNLRVFQGTQLARGGCTCARSWDRAGGSRSTARTRLYDYSWFVGFAVSFVAYYAMMNFTSGLPFRR